MLVTQTVEITENVTDKQLGYGLDEVSHSDLTHAVDVIDRKQLCSQSVERYMLDMTQKAGVIWF